MNRALWQKAVGEVRLILPAFILLMFAFQIMFVWLTSQVDLQYVRFFLETMPDNWKKLLPVSIDAITTYAGRVAVGYDHPIVVFGLAYWAIARGSDAVSGPLGRGTLEITLAQPIRRTEVLLVSAAMTTLGCALMATATGLGTWAGLELIPKMRDIDPCPYIGSAINLFCYAFFLGGATTLLSSADRSRARTVGLMSAFYIGSLLLKVVGKISSNFDWLLYGSFLTAYEPQKFVATPDQAWELALHYDTPLIVAGLGCYLAAAVIFTRRDLPAPL